MELTTLTLVARSTSHDAIDNVTLPEPVTSFLKAAQQNDVASVRTLINGNSLLIWFYVVPDRLGPIVESAATGLSKQTDAFTAFHAVLAQGTSQLHTNPGSPHARSQRPAVEAPFFTMIEVFRARFQGRTTEAHSLISAAFPTQQPLVQFRDYRNAWPQFIALQKGITAMLAGHLFEAFGHYYDAIMRPSPTHLEFLTREALIKAALIHAAFGDPEEARSLLNRADKIRRTSSWIEDSLDAAHVLAHALIEVESASMIDKLSVIDASNIGEMWPFYVHAHYRVLEISSSNAFALKQIALLKSLPFASRAGEGYPGSVFQLAETSLCITAGSPQKARKQLDMADQHLVLSRVLRVLLELQVGSNIKAIQLASEIRDETLPFRRMELWRISLLAQAHVNVGQLTEAKHVLSQVTSLPRPLQRSEVAYFSKQIRTLFADSFSQSPAVSDVDKCYLDALPAHDVQLSEREYQILLMLPSGKPNKEIAQELYISVNTVKSQLQAIFRKLGARSREEALRNAAARGLL